MNPAKLKEATVNYGKPAAWTEEQCGNLQVWEGKLVLDTQGNTSEACVSAWEMTEEEFEMFKKTRRLYLSVFFPKQMPVGISVVNPITGMIP